MLKEPQVIESAGDMLGELGAGMPTKSDSGFDQRSFAFHIGRLATLRKKVSAASLAGGVLDAWFRRSYPSLSSAELSVPASLKKNADVNSFAAALSQLSLLEAAYWLSSAYAKLLHGERRKALSMYFTPPLLAARVLDDLAASGVKFDTGTFLDPACSSSAFLVPIALRMKQSMHGQSASDIIKHVELHLHGVDLDPTLCTLSRQFLRAVLYEEIQAASIEPRFSISTGNSLLDTKRLEGAIDVVVCNPPYRKMTANEVRAIGPCFESVLAPQPNLYGVFIALCINLIKENAICAVVTPTSFLSGHSFARLRDFLTKSSRLISIGIVSAREGVFIDVQQETAVTTMRRGQGAPSTSASVSLISPNGECTPIGRCAIPKHGSAWPVPRIPSDAKLIEKAANLTYRLADYGYQIRVGNYVWNRDRRKAYISANMARLHNSENSVPLLWSSDIKPGKAIYFDGAKKANGERRFVVFKDKYNSSVVRRPCVLLQRVTSNDEPKRLIAAAVPKSLFNTYGGFVGENHTVILIPTNSRPVLSPNQLAALLGCPEIDRLFRCISGATNVSVFELGQLPLPDPHALKELLKCGRSIESAMQELMQG